MIFSAENEEEFNKASKSEWKCFWLSVEGTIVDSVLAVLKEIWNGNNDAWCGKRIWHCRSGRSNVWFFKKLPSDYYVVHSFKNLLHEGEVDFVIFNRTKGLLCLEAKAGAIKYEGGYWKYSSGCIMKHGGPYNQAAEI